ncbi:MAG: methyltransferase domain-containing protein [Chloroflexi bacterium]|nr:methyltransferase domain-containing protein [Chloroflexota bacterium]
MIAMVKAARAPRPHKFPPEGKERLLSPERAQRLDPGFVVDLLPLERYHTVADIGCGPGYFTIPLGLALSEGQLYALDVQQEMVQACRRLVRRAKVPNVQVLRSEESSLPVPDGSLDGAFLAFSFHEAWDRPALLRAAVRALKQGGWLSIVEWNKEPMDEGPPLKERLSALDCLDLAEPIGFRLLDHALLNEQHYLVTFRLSERPAKRRVAAKKTPAKTSPAKRPTAKKAAARVGKAPAKTSTPRATRPKRAGQPSGRSRRS